MKILSVEQVQRIEELDNPQEYLTPTEHDQYIYSKGFYDIEFFTDYYLSHYKINKDTGQSVPTPPFHLEIWDSLRYNKRTCIIIPRDHAKTTSVKMFLIWSICYKYDKAILLFMPDALGVKTIGDIRDEFENNADIVRMFGVLVPKSQEGLKSKKWTGNFLQFSNGVELQAVKKKGAVRGQRPTLLIVDDPQELEDVLNEAMAKKFSHRFWSSVYNTLQPTGRCGVLGTVLSKNCLVNEIKEKKKQFNVITYKAIENIKKVMGRIVGGKALWPELWPIAALEERRIDIGDGIFDQEYQNIAHNYNHRPVFTTSLALKIVKPLKVQNEIEFYIDSIDEDLIFGIDTAEGHKDSDFSTIIGRKRNGKLAVVYRARVPEDVLAQRMDYIFDLGYRGIVAPERNKGNLFIATCKQFWWFDQYIYQQLDESTDREAESAYYGWHTNVSSKRLMIGEYDVILRYCSEKTNGTTLTEGLLAKWQENANIEGITEWEMSPELQQEILKYAWDDKGAAGALPGYHDDLLMADMICNQARKMRSPVAINLSLEELGL
jgi:hypothetical protein